ncbi:MAG: cation:proton antiporter, partial [Nitrospirota bacterium]|nr:cation:proton antiporter [Nitrospirota bacterium]
FAQTKLPDVLLLILVGIVLGPVLGLVEPAQFGSVGSVFTTITLIMLLFQEGSEMSLPTLAKAMRDASWLAAANFLAVTVAVGSVALTLTGLSPIPAFLFGAMVGSSSPAVVVPLARQLSVREESRSILFLESALGDVLTIVVVLALLEANKPSDVHLLRMSGRILGSFVLASLLGVLGGVLWSLLLGRIRMLKNAMFTTPAFAFVIFGLVELLGVSGYIGALAFGITLGNIRAFNRSRFAAYLDEKVPALTDTERSFFSEAAFLLKTFFFVYVGVTVQLADPPVLSLAALLTLLILLVRIPVVRLCVRRTTPVGDASLMAAMIPKGLAAVVLASLPLQRGMPDGALIQQATHVLVLFTIVATALLVFLLERTPLGRGYGWLFSGLGKPEPERAEPRT